MTPTQLRLVSFLEGLSFLFLLGVAMPLKYMFDNPVLVPYAGMAHGVLFIAFVVVLLIVCQRQGWSLMVFVFGLVAAFLPFMPFVFERYIAKKVASEQDDFVDEV